MLVSYGCRFEVDNSFTIDDTSSAAEHAQVTTLSHASRCSALCAPIAHAVPLQLLAAGLHDDSLYPELHISVKLPYQIHDIYLALTMPRLYARCLRCRGRAEPTEASDAQAMNEGGWKLLGTMKR